MSKNILIITEGIKPEIDNFNLLIQKNFLPKEYFYNIYFYGTDIVRLYKEVSKEENLDIFEYLKNRDNNFDKKNMLKII